MGVCRLVQEKTLLDRVNYTSSSATTALTPIFTKEYGPLIPLNTKDASVANTYYRSGVFNFKIASAVTVANGDHLYYTLATSNVTNVAPATITTTTAFYVGRAVTAGSATAGYVDVEVGGANNSLVINQTATAANEIARIWGSTTATSGIFRGLSVRTFFTAAGTATGDALRVYNQTDVSIGNMHGIHSTAQLGSETVASVGTVTGQAAGVRATIGIGLTNTAPAGGTLASLRLDSYFLSTAGSAATSYIYACDVDTTYGVDAFIRLGAMVNRSTNKAAPLAYTYVSGHMTLGNCDGALRVVTPDATLYIPLIVSFS
jgi:hypothetical protein